MSQWCHPVKVRIHHGKECVFFYSICVKESQEMLHLQDKSSSLPWGLGKIILTRPNRTQEEPWKRLFDSGSTSGSLHHTGLFFWERYPLLPLKVISRRLHHSPLSALSWVALVMLHLHQPFPSLLWEFSLQQKSEKCSFWWFFLYWCEHSSTKWGEKGSHSDSSENKNLLVISLKRHFLKTWYCCAIEIPLNS